MSKLRFVGLDVHAETIAVAVAEAGGEVRSLGIIPNRPGIGAEDDRQAGAGREAEMLLRSRSDGLRAVLAAHADGRGLRSDCAVADSESRPATG